MVHMHRYMLITMCTYVHMHVCDSSVYSFSYSLVGLIFKFHYYTYVTHTHPFVNLFKCCLFLVHNNYVPEDLYMPIHAHPYAHMHTHACCYTMHTDAHTHAHTCSPYTICTHTCDPYVLIWTWIWGSCV